MALLLGPGPAGADLGTLDSPTDEFYLSPRGGAEAAMRLAPIRSGRLAFLHYSLA